MQNEQEYIGEILEEVILSAAALNHGGAFNISKKWVSDAAGVGHLLRWDSYNRLWRVSASPVDKPTTGWKVEPLGSTDRKVFVHY